MRRHSSLTVIALTLLAIAGAMSAFAQGNELVVIQGITAHSLSGVVHDPVGGVIADVAVILFPCPAGKFQGIPEPQPLLVTKADANGKFALVWPKSSRVCLQFQYPGFNTLQVQVRRSKVSGVLRPVLTVGT